MSEKNICYRTGIVVNDKLYGERIDRLTTQSIPLEIEYDRKSYHTHAPNPSMRHMHRFQQRVIIPKTIQTPEKASLADILF